MDSFIIVKAPASSLWMIAGRFNYYQVFLNMDPKEAWHLAVEMFHWDYFRWAVVNHKSEPEGDTRVKVSNQQIHEDSSSQNRESVCKGLSQFIFIDLETFHRKHRNVNLSVSLEVVVKLSYTQLTVEVWFHTGHEQRSLGWKFCACLTHQ